MFRWIVVLATVALAGCATDYRGYGYYDRYDDVYVDDGTYYRDDAGYAGDYYYDYGSDYGYGSSVGISAYDYPGYYSLFWDLNRSVYDPYWHPRFYYGVTWFPRDYFSLSWRSGWPGSYYRYSPYRSLYYSPYRYSWVDSYYDWYPYYRHRNHDRDRHHWYAPRYGNARHEAERLARWESRRERSLPGNRPGGYVDRDRVVRNPDRSADYYGRPQPRLDPGVRGYDRDVAVDRRGADYGRQQGPRLDPGLRGGDRPWVDGERGPVVRQELPRRPTTHETSRRGADYGRPDEQRLDARDLVRQPRLDPGVRGYDRGPVERTQRPIDVERGSRDASGYTVRTPPRPQGYPMDGIRHAPGPPPQRDSAPSSRPMPERGYPASRERGDWSDRPERAMPRESAAPPRQPARFERPMPAQQQSAPPPVFRAPPPARHEPPPSRVSNEPRSEPRSEPRREVREEREERRRGRDDR